jgi:long-chain acyl-CoA synthetase
MTEPRTISELLRQRSEDTPRAVAQRVKRLGEWQESTWREVHARVQRLAAALSARDFRAGDALLIAAEVQPEAAEAALAALELGGHIMLLGGPLDEPATGAWPAEVQSPRFVLAQDLTRLTTLTAVLPTEPHFALCVEPQGLYAQPADRVAAYSDLIATASTPREKAHEDLASLDIARILGAAQANALALLAVLPGDGAARSSSADAHPRQPRVLRWSHAQLLEAVAGLPPLAADHDAFVAELSSQAHLGSVLALWLLVGFRVHYAEHATTADFDRRELGPSLLVASDVAYARLHARVLAQLPEAGTLHRALVDWALAGRRSAAGDVVGEWLVRRPLRAVLGLAHVRAAWVIGSQLPAESAAFFSRVGLPLQPMAAVVPEVTQPLAALGLRERAEGSADRFDVPPELAALSGGGSP